MILIRNLVLLTLFCAQLSFKSAVAEETKHTNEAGELQSVPEDSIDKNAQNQSSDTPQRRRRSSRHTVNLALRKPTVQSSTFEKHTSNLAVDGNPNADHFKQSCSHTANNGAAWWAVDLGLRAAVAHVRITNRGDCCGERLKNFYIGVTEMSPWTTKPPVLSNGQICSHYTGSPPTGVLLDIHCDAVVQGRYLYIMLSQPDYLSLCEVEVYAG